jgi:hypothetical protein
MHHSTGGEQSAVLGVVELDRDSGDKHHALAVLLI